MKDNKEDIKGYIIAIIVGALLAVIIKLDEDNVKTIYEGGRFVSDFTEFDVNSENFIKHYNIGVLGSDNALSKQISDDVKKLFYDKSLPKDSILSYNEDSSISKDLHINYAFQKEYYTKLIVPYLCKYLDSNHNLKNIANYAKCYNFSNKFDIATYSFYGLMGATQHVDFDFDVYKRIDGKYHLVDLKITIQDWYGADKDDILSKREGFSINKIEKANISCLNAFFWLQHHFGCSPFKTEITFHDYLLISK